MKNKLKKILKKLTSNEYILNIIDKIFSRRSFYERLSIEDNKFFDLSNINEVILQKLFEKTSFTGDNLDQ